MKQKTHIFLGFILMFLITMANHFHPLPVPVHMLSLSVLIVYVSCYIAVPMQADDAQVVESTLQNQKAETVQTRDVYMFPIMGSLVLFSLYLIFKFVPKEYVNLVIQIYFFAIGVVVVGHRLGYIFGSLLPSSLCAPLSTPVISFRIPFSKQDQIKVSSMDIICLCISAGIAYAYLVTKLWSLSNFFGICFCIQGIELLNLGSFRNGFILLLGLFVYDIFWVFGTDVMVTVAKNFDAPVKLLFPLIEPSPSGSNYSMLGLGDIVVPGIFISLMLRFDYFLHLKREHSKRKLEEQLQDEKIDPSHLIHERIPMPYFYAQLVFYFLGLATTVAVMYWFKHAQPALLYLVPAALIASFGTAIVRGELKQLWHFEEEAEEKKAKEVLEKLKEN